jgi:hypothetical protein
LAFDKAAERSEANLHWPLLAESGRSDFSDVQIRTSENSLPDGRFTPESSRSGDTMLNDR